MTPAGQRWTRSKPTEPGWYWYRGNSATPETAVRVERGFKLYTATFFLTNSSVRHPVDDLNGEWLGPITPDSYQQGRVAGLREAHVFAMEAGAFYTAHRISALIDKAQQAQEEKGVGDE